MKTILVDCDGVLADLVGGLCKTSVPHLTPDSFNKYSFRDSLSATDHNKIVYHMFSDGFARNLEWYPGAQTFVRRLRELGKVLCITAATNSNTWHSDRLAWLNDTIHANDVLFVPSDHKHTVSGDFLIEDNAENCLAWVTSNPIGRAILVDRPWNRDVRKPHTRVFRAQNLGDVLRLMKGLT